MSWDVSLAIDTGVELTEVIDIGNYTSNVHTMYSEALGFPFRDLHGKNAGDVVPLLDKAVNDMTRRPQHYEQFNPPNGWGDFDSALDFLSKLLSACKKHPKCTVWIF